MDKIAGLAEYLGAWLKELIKTLMEMMDWFNINFGGDDAE